MRSKSKLDKHFNTLLSKLSLIFMAFLMIALIFGFIYYYTYRNDPTCVIIAKPIAQKRVLDEQLEKLGAMKRDLNESISYLGEEIQKLQKEKSDDEISESELKLLRRKYLHADTSVNLSNNWDPSFFPYLPDTLRAPSIQIMKVPTLKYVTLPRYQNVTLEDGSRKWVQYYSLLTTYEDILSELDEKGKELLSFVI